MTTPQTNEVAPQDMAEPLEALKSLTGSAMASCAFLSHEQIKKEIARFSSMEEKIRVALSGSREKELMECIAEIKELAGRSMDFGSDNDVIQKIYVLANEAKNRKA